MDGPVTFQMLSAVTAALITVGSAWFFIDRRIKEVEKSCMAALERFEGEGSMQSKAALAEISLLRETLYTKYVSNDALIRLEERILSEIRELRQFIRKDRQG